MTFAAILVLGLGAVVIAWCLWVLTATRDEGVAAIRARTRQLRVLGQASPSKVLVMETALARIEAGLDVSDISIADLVNATGAPVEVVFDALDEMAASSGGN